MEDTGQQAESVEVETSGLPSEQVEVSESGFNISSDDLTDGKFQGRWSNPQEMADYIKNIEDKHSNLTREVSDSSKQTDAEIQQTAEELKAQQLQDDTIKSLLPQYVENGMVMTDEIKEALMATGLTEEKIRLGAYELKEALDTNAGYVGGKENYNIIMDYHAENMSDEEKIAFNHSIQDPNHSEALLVGLQVMYERSVGSEQPDKTPDRVRGNPVQNNAIKAYETKAELLRDKKYADSRVSSSADKARFRARLKATPDNVWLS